MNLFNFDIETAITPDAHAAGSVAGAVHDCRNCDKAFYVMESGTAEATTTLDVKCQEAAWATLVDDLNDTIDTGLPLRYDTADNTELGVAFTTPNNDGVAVIAVRAKFKAVGTLAAGKIITATIQADSSDTPDDTDLISPVTGDKAPDELSTTAYETVSFVFPTPVHLAANTKYWIVFEGDFALSTSNHVLLGIDTVGSGGNINIHDADWGTQVTTQVGIVAVEGYDFTDISGAAFGQVTAANDNEVYGLQVSINRAKPYQRLLATLANDAADFGVTAFLPKNVRPPSQENTVVVA